jgi:alkylation response protein AidB-like acyl-CoA dehydrogenase
LTTTFVITQRTGACRRIAEGTNAALKQRLLPPLASGQMHATVAVSHLTTSHRHQGQPVLTALRTSGGWRLDGFSPWSTGADHADVIVTGADVVEHDQPTGQQILIAVPANQPGVSTPPAPRFVALSAAHTGRFEYDGVELDDSWLVQGPVENVMTAGKSTKPGGHETSTLALGVAQAAIDFLHHESQARDDLRAARKALAAEHADLFASLLALSRGEPACSTQQVRSRANSLVLRASQAALAAAKGTGYVEGHPAGRWCREALFFLVWSCPQPVMNANLCELAGIAE